MLSNAFLGCIIFLVTNISLLYTTHLLVRRFLPNAPASVRIVAIFTLFYAYIVVLFQVLSPFHAITKTGVTISCLLIALISHLMWGKLSNFKADIEPIRIWIRDGLDSKWACLLIVCGFVVLLSFFRALLMPPLAWDSLTYHLTFAALWIKKGTILLLTAPDQIADNAYFPINGQLFASWFLLPFHTDLLVNTMNFPITLLGGVSCYAIARELGLSRKEASFAPVLICFAPVIYSQITNALVENAVFAFSSTSVLFTLRYLKKGHLNDGIFALVAAGIMLGIKHPGVPLAGLVLLAIAIKTMRLTSYPNLVKRFSFILFGLIILITLGGRQYILNFIDAGNPLYPFPLKIFQHEIFEGSYKWEQQGKWVSEYEKKLGLDQYSWWEREYRRVCYIKNNHSFFPITAGPKFLLFLILALISFFIRPPSISKQRWYFLSIMWIVPLVLFYTNTSANLARKGPWLEYSTRFLSPYIALFTIQGLVLLKRIRNYFKEIDFFLIALIAWDLLYINKTHIEEVSVLYPFIILIILLVITLFKLVIEKSTWVDLKEGIFKYLGSVFARLPGLCSLRINQWTVYVMGFIVLVVGLSSLQSYRDNTRYNYYRTHSDHQKIPTTLVKGWEFLDNSNEKKTIALTMGDKPPGGHWFFYPLLGRWLQNDIVYVSAKYQWEVPAWLHRGLLRGNDGSLWLNNLKRIGVDYIFVQEPWPIELEWIERYKDKFKLVFTDKNCKIFRYTGEYN